jgi:hypothetical protein
MSDSDQDDDMTDRRRSYIDPASGEFLFLEWDTRQDGWVPELQTIRKWQQGQLRIYQPSDRPTTFITVPGFIRWPQVTDSEQDDIKQVLAYPWIPDGQAMENLTEEDIFEAELSIRHMVEDSMLERATGLLEDILRPSLVMDMPLTLLTVVPRRDPEYDRHLAAALMGSLSGPLQSDQPPAQKPQQNPFPKHLVASVLAKAEADGQLCPITMEPIKKTTAYITSCGHVFQQSAIRHWLQDKTTCPECRQPCV